MVNRFYWKIDRHCRICMFTWKRFFLSEVAQIFSKIFHAQWGIRSEWNGLSGFICCNALCSIIPFYPSFVAWSLQSWGLQALFEQKKWWVSFISTGRSKSFLLFLIVKTLIFDFLKRWLSGVKIFIQSVEKCYFSVFNLFTLNLLLSVELCCLFGKSLNPINPE